MATVSVEAWCDPEIYIRSWFGGRCGTNNDKTMMQFSPLIIYIISGDFNIFLPVTYTLVPGGKTRRTAQVLGNGIYTA